MDDPPRPHPSPPSPGGMMVMGEAIDALRRMPRRRGLAVVVSDFLGDLSWEEPLRALGSWQQVLAIEVVDPRELELPNVGLLQLVDPETGEQLEVQTTDRELRARFAEAARVQRATIAAGLRRARAAHLQLRTDRDWMLDIVRFAGEQRRRRTR
jgi:uncharacterized protein (DUF58 family)